MYLTHTCCICKQEFERDSVPTDYEVCDRCHALGYRGASVTSTTSNIVKKSFNLSIFFEWVKLVQRVIMVGLTIFLIAVMSNVNTEIKGVKIEMQKLTELTVKALNIAEVTRLEMMKQIDEIQKDGIKFHIRLW